MRSGGRGAADEADEVVGGDAAGVGEADEGMPAQGAEVVHVPVVEDLAPSRAGGGDDAVVVSLLAGDDAVGEQEPGSDALPRDGADHGAVAGVGAVGGGAVELGEGGSGEFLGGADVDAEGADEVVDLESLAEVELPELGEAGAAVGGGEGDEGGDVAGHVEVGEHVPCVEAAERVGEDDHGGLHLAGAKLAEDAELELACSAGDGAGGVDAGAENGVAFSFEAAGDAGKLLDGDRTELQPVEPEDAVMEDHRKHERGLYLRRMGLPCGDDG